MTTAGLELAPFRGVRYAPERIRDVAAVTSPPYDVVEPDGLAALEAADERNVVRLILPRAQDGQAEGRYAHAADLLRRWLTDGTLLTDERPVLYVYEQERDGVGYRGLLGALGLRDPRDRVVLPHEDTMPGLVADRLALMRAAAANLEPILLTYDGGGPASEIVDEVIAAGPPMMAAAIAGSTHRVWRLSGSSRLTAVAVDLWARQALIADGHHRYAAYLGLQAERRRAAGPGPWDRGLALLVDAAAHPLQLRAIHRVLRGRPAAGLVAALPAPAWEVTRWSDERQNGALLAAVERLGPDRTGFAVTDDVSSWLVERRSPGPTGRHGANRVRLDTEVLHEEVLPELWGVRDQDRDVEYHHEAEAACRAAGRTNGAALLLKATTVSAVLAAAAGGRRMPRKSTSFGPKPVTGLVLRTFDAG